MIGKQFSKSIRACSHCFAGSFFLLLICSIGKTLNTDQRALPVVRGNSDARGLWHSKLRHFDLISFELLEGGARES